jgi:folate-dependent phosphoribosylglycinamide formyltransferase PurN
MNILLLGPAWRNADLKKFLESHGDKCVMSQDAITTDFIECEEIDLILSSGYHQRVAANVITAVSGNVINLHATYLPWGKGIGTTFFAYLLGHPKGVSVHYIDEHIDTGDIILRQQVTAAYDDTLRTFYHSILDETEKLFRENWLAIRDGRCERLSQTGLGENVPYFSRTDSERFMDELPLKWDTPLDEIEIWGAEMAVSESFWNRYEADNTD